MATRRPNWEYEKIILGSKIRRSIAKTITYRVSKGVQQKMDYYTTDNPQTVPQQAWRGSFADAVAAWQSLSTADQDKWRNFILD